MNEQESIRHGIANRLKLAREMAGLTQGQVASQLGWHRPTVSEIEAGRRKVPAEELKTLSDLYGINVPWLMGEGQEEHISDRAKLAARQLDKLSEEDLDRLLLLLRSLKSSDGG